MSFTTEAVTVTEQLNFSGATVLNTGTLTFPETSCNILGDTTTNTVTNKNITGTTNTVDANNLRNGSTWEYPLGGAAASSGQFLGYNGTSIVWGTPGGSPTSGTNTTTGATTVNTETIPTVTGTTYLVKTSVVGRRTDTAQATGNVGVTCTGTFTNISGTLTSNGLTTLLQNNSLSNNPPNATLAINSANIVVQVTGVAGQNYTWLSNTVTISI